MLLAFFRAELKKTALAIPRVAGMALLLALLTLGVALGAGRTFEAEKGARLKLAFSLPGDGGAVTGILLSTLRAMESVESSLELEVVDEAAALAMVQSGQAAAAVLVPEGFIDDIIYGVNSPALVVMQSAGSMQGVLLRGTAESAARMLKVSQCGLYAVYEAAELSGMSPEFYDELVQQVNLLYIRSVTGRDELVATRPVWAFGALSTGQYVAASALLLLLLLVGCALPGAVAEPPHAMCLRLRALGCTGAGAALARLACLLLLNLSLLLPLVALACLCGLPLQWQALYRLLPAIFTATCLQFAVFNIFPGRLAPVLVQFLLGAALAFFSGALVPAAFLPEAVQSVARWLPAYPMLLQARHAVAGSGGTELLCMAHGAVLLALGLAAACRRWKRL